VNDDVYIKIYQSNTSAKYNGKIIEAVLFGCSPDCYNAPSNPVTVYELCETAPCTPKFTLEVNCDPNKLLTSPNKSNPTLNFVISADGKTSTVGTVNTGSFVVINGEKIYL
jgi:hypothetical protein